ALHIGFEPKPLSRSVVHSIFNHIQLFMHLCDQRPHNGYLLAQQVAEILIISFYLECADNLKQRTVIEQKYHNTKVQIVRRQLSAAP
ncbi:MAG: hypothetical protein RLZZ479_917, partial [Bacteroidota bacterium]